MYYIVYGILYLFSLLPLKVLYLFSDCGCFILYRLVRYRRKIVLQNIEQAFPEKLLEERKQIEKKFYRNFTDNFIEVIKLISASKKFIRKHFTGNYTLPDKLYLENKKCHLLLGHNFNWELGCLAVADRIQQTFLGVYMPISNKIFDRLFIKIRSKTGAALLPATEMRTAILPYRNTTYLMALMADQNPGVPSKAFWFNFFNKPAPFHKGPESGARLGNLPVLFCQIIKQKRGYYHIVFEMGEENPAAVQFGEVTKKYVAYLHRIMREQPENWLWSHRRWKWEWKEEYGNILN
ncbi:MAG: lipid A biosynthesis acyltransferase [Chitinophagaceae bacterium]